MKLSVPTPDGRTLEVVVSGPENGFPLVYHHGTPSGVAPFPTLERPAAERNLRVIAYSRPGYGDSTPHPGGPTAATVADDARDTATILDHLGLGEFVTLGWSGGGPRSLACAGVLPDRCLAAACCVGLAPPSEYDDDIVAGMAPENVAEFGAAYDGPEALERFLSTQTGYFSVTAEQVAQELGGLAPPVDRAALDGGEIAEHLAASFRAAGRQGIVGWRDDDLTMIRPWGFDLGQITVPVAVWQGTEDTMVPFAHAEWLATHVKGARPQLVEGEGHLSLMKRMDVILDDLLDLAGL